MPNGIGTSVNLGLTETRMTMSQQTIADAISVETLATLKEFDAKRAKITDKDEPLPESVIRALKSLLDADMKAETDADAITGQTRLALARAYHAGQRQGYSVRTMANNTDDGYQTIQNRLKTLAMYGDVVAAWRKELSNTEDVPALYGAMYRLGAGKGSQSARDLISAAIKRRVKVLAHLPSAAVAEAVEESRETIKRQKTADAETDKDSGKTETAETETAETAPVSRADALADALALIADAVAAEDLTDTERDTLAEIAALVNG